MLKRIIALTLSFLLVFGQSGFAQMAVQPVLPDVPSAKADAADSRPLHLRSLSYTAESESFELLLDKGTQQFTQAQVRAGAGKLLEYFFTGISLPNDCFWVNLRPYSPEAMIDPRLAATDVGRVLLEADVQLKKDTARLTSPSHPIGKEYWDKLYMKAEELFGKSDVTIPTVARPWIMPDEIILREGGENAYIYKATLKVQVRRDDLSAVGSPFDQSLNELNDYSARLISELVVPALTREVNRAGRYSRLRQVYYSLILAQWFKQAFTPDKGVYGKLINSGNLRGIASQQEWSKEKYFKEYQDSFLTGEYDSSEVLRTWRGSKIRSSFCGGISFHALCPPGAVLRGRQGHGPVTGGLIRVWADGGSDKDCSATNIRVEPFNVMRGIFAARLLVPEPRTAAHQRARGQVDSMLASILGASFNRGDSAVLEREIDKIELTQISPSDILELIDLIGAALKGLQEAVNDIKEQAYLPKTVAAHEFTTIVPLDEGLLEKFSVEYERIGIAVYLYQKMIAGIRVEGTMSVRDLNGKLLLKILRTGRVELEDIDDRPTREFLAFLQDKGITNAMITGGSVRDILLGRHPDDFDVACALPELSHAQRGVALNPVNEGSEEIWAVADRTLKQLADALDTQVLLLFRPNDPRAPKFNGYPVEWCGPLKLFGENVILRQMLGERKTQELYPSSSGPTVLRVGIDAEGNFYGRRGLLDYILGRVTIEGGGNNYSLGAVIRTLRLHYQFGLRIEDGVEAAIIGSMERYLNGLTPIGESDYPIALRQLGKIRKAIAGDSLREAELDETLQRLKIKAVMDMVEKANRVYSLRIDYRTISQDNLPVFWGRLRANGEPDTWGLRFDLLVKNLMGDQFYEEIRQKKTERIELRIGAPEQVHENGWLLKEMPVEQFDKTKGVIPYNPRLYRLEKDGRVRYVFTGITSNRHLHHYLSMLKALNFPVSSVVIRNDHAFDLDDYYRAYVAGRFGGTDVAVVGLNILLEPFVDTLRSTGFSEIERGEDSVCKYLMLEKDGKKVLCVYLNSIMGDACASFMSALYGRGIRNYVFWGTAGGLQTDQQYMDGIDVERVHHTDSAEIRRFSDARNINRDRPGANDTENGILNVTTVFGETVPILRNFSEMGLAAVEIELFGVQDWANRHEDAEVDVYLNLSEVLSWQGHAAGKYNSLGSGDKTRIFNSQVAHRIGEITGNGRWRRVMEGGSGVTGDKRGRDGGRKGREVGGIDLNSLAAMKFSGNISRGDRFFTLERVRAVGDIDLEPEKCKIGKMLAAGIIPSNQRVADYVIALWGKGGLRDELDSVLDSIAAIMRIEESRAIPAGQDMRDLLASLESEAW